MTAPETKPSRTLPAPIAFRRSRRLDGGQHLVAVLTEPVTLPAGSRLVLHRLHDGDRSGPEFTIQRLPADVPSTNAERERASLDRLDGSLLDVLAARLHGRDLADRFLKALPHWRPASSAAVELVDLLLEVVADDVTRASPAGSDRT